VVAEALPQSDTGTEFRNVAPRREDAELRNGDIYGEMFLRHDVENHKISDDDLPCLIEHLHYFIAHSKLTTSMFIHTENDKIAFGAYIKQQYKS